MILDALGDQDIVIKLIVQGADGLNIIIGVDENVFEKSIQALYQRFLF